MSATRVSYNVLLFVFAFFYHPIYAAENGTAHNAATHYQNAFMLFDQTGIKPRHNKDITEGINNLTVFYPCNSDSKMEEIINELHKGYEIDKCDWETDFSEGEWSVVPYLTSAKHLTDFTFSRSIESFQNHNRAQACDILVYAMTLARRISVDKRLTLLSTSYEQQIKGLILARHFLKTLDKQEVALFYEKWSKMPKMTMLRDSIIFERDVLKTWIKNNPVVFFRYLNSAISGDLAGFRYDDNVALDDEQRMAVAKEEKVRYDLIDLYYDDCLKAIELPLKECKDRLDHLYNDIDTIKSRAPLTAKILHELSPAFSVYCEKKHEFDQIEAEVLELFNSCMARCGCSDSLGDLENHETLPQNGKY